VAPVANEGDFYQNRKIIDSGKTQA